MNKNEIIKKVSGTVNKLGLKFKKHSPEILIVAGVIGTVTSAVLACKATTKIGEIMDETKETIDCIHTAVENEEVNGEAYSEEDGKKDLTIVYVQTGLKFVKLYAPSVILGALSITGILASNNILRKRNVALAAAYTAVDKGFKDYRKRVVERFGEQIDKELKYNIKAKKFEEIEIDKNGKEKKVEKTIDIADPNTYSEYARFFDDGCLGWEKDSEHNLYFLRAQQQFANDKLRADGYLFLNDVYYMLGIPKTKAGQIVGWVYDDENNSGDNFVDFGIYEVNRERTRAFVNGYERTILLDFNVDGNILDLI